MHRIVFFGLLALPALADVCALTDIQGSFGIQLSGTSTISGSNAPAATVGRLVFAADRNISGYSSVNFNGLFLGNPVTGSYQFASDCSLAYRLQDTSGGWQSFAGKARPGGARVEIHQTDSGAGAAGTMQKTASVCSASAMVGIYTMTFSANATPLARDSVAGATERVEADGNGGLTFAWPRGPDSGTYRVDGECFVELEFAPPAGDPVKLRGVLVDNGAEVLAVTTDPQAVGTARFRK